MLGKIPPLVRCTDLISTTDFPSLNERTRRLISILSTTYLDDTITRIVFIGIAIIRQR